MVLKKVYNKNKRRPEWALVSKSNPDKILQYFGTKKPSKARFIKAERRVQMFKHMSSIPKRRIKIKRNDGVKQTYWINIYKKIADRAKNKGYKIPKLQSGKGAYVSEIDIPEKFEVDGFTMPIEGSMNAWSKKDAKRFKNRFLVGIDNDAPPKNKVRAFAHELMHIHMDVTGEKPHTELKAEKGGADILGMPLDEFTDNIKFDQNWYKAGIQLKKKR